MDIIYGLDAVDVIVILTSILAFVLGIISLIAYNRDQRKKVLFMAFAFFIVVLKGVLIISGDIFSFEENVLDLLAHTLDFVVLLSFFFAIMTK